MLTNKYQGSLTGTAGVGNGSDGGDNTGFEPSGTSFGSALGGRPTGCSFTGFSGTLGIVGRSFPFFGVYEVGLMRGCSVEGSFGFS